MAASTTLRPNSEVGFLRFPFNRQVLSASTGVLFVYLFAGLRVQIGMLTQLGLTGIDASNWFFITWMTTGMFSLIVAFAPRLPLSINLSIPALIFLAGAAGGFTLPEILGANLAVGIAAVLIRSSVSPALSPVLSPLPLPWPFLLAACFPSCPRQLN